ncbi:GNAT family N-acetyltransferase [Sediminicurvatus halobius]|uniref:GNAT family N-acetyltransferase n=1 Tax=Sediminicurvatus halobius TaxID=2182432 RepID=A0A2U2MWT4_9GAMM|nr:GNAT family N-acetyltransferase [Spiribacter halobius]PWG61328.1 GNAT family N-acetyltransferase [Spiribacter halobius]UEX79706.1 GNAT family N-acetyltransferase [Spiribacter halobius]
MTPVRLEAHTGASLEAHLDTLAALRIRVFRDFPYLYAGDADYERRYLRTYAEAQGAVVVLALAGDRAVGAATGMPLAEETENLRAPFRSAGFDPAQVFYFGESVLEPAWRGQGIGVSFFDAREAHARGLGGFQWTAFCAVERPADHPRRPPGYTPLDGFWRRRGYRRRDDLRARMAWRDLDHSEETDKPMVFWLKALQP